VNTINSGFNGSGSQPSGYCGDNICQSSENSGTCTHDCNAWTLFRRDSNNSGYSEEVSNVSNPGVFEVMNFTTLGLLGNFVSAPFLADVDNDNDLEVIIRGGNGLKVFYNNYTIMWQNSGFSSSVDIGKYFAITSPDANNDSFILLSIYDGFYSVYAKNGTTKWHTSNTPTYSGSWLYLPKMYPLLADIDNDGVEEFLFAHHILNNGLKNNTLSALDSVTGEIEWKFLFNESETDYYALNTPAAADLDNNGIVEVVTSSNSGKLYVLNGNNGTPQWNYTIGETESSPALADLDSDGKLEIIIGSSNNYLYALYPNGSLMCSYNS